MANTTIEFTTEDEDGNEVVHDLPARFEVCPRCGGTGTHVNPSIDGHGITEEERERDWSPEEWDQYLTGFYDVTCYECRGLRVVRIVDEATCDPQLLKEYRKQLREDEAYNRMCEMERRYGA